MSQPLKIVPVLLAGGQGERLWPLSRPDLPKQFLALNGTLTLFQETLLRLKAAPVPDFLMPPVIVAHESHHTHVQEQLKAVNCHDAMVVLEPERNNTAAAIACAAHAIHDRNPDAVLLVMPTDHKMDNPAHFFAAVEAGMASVHMEKLVTFGITPTHAACGYGYIQACPLHDAAHAASRILHFIEKPCAERAQALVDAGHCYWNAGIFLMPLAALREELRTHAPDLFRHTEKAVRLAQRWGDTLLADREAYGHCPSIAFDRAVMEHTARGVVVPLQCGWSDLGSWEMLHAAADKDSSGNAAMGNVMLAGATNTYIRSEGPVVKVVGVDNIVAVATPEAVLITSRTSEGGITADREQAVTARPWGSYEVLDTRQGMKIKRLDIAPLSALSLQRHEKRAEHWIVISGTAVVTCNGKTQEIACNGSFYVPRESLHRLENRTDEPLVIIEVQLGDEVSEDDIIRYDDRYGRTA